MSPLENLIFGYSTDHTRNQENKMSEITKTMDQAVKAITVQTGKYLTFFLEKEEYGIGILKVKEIIGMMPITSIPGTPDFVKGVINLRGKVIPVMDLRLKFSMEAIPYSDRTCIIVVEIESQDSTVLMGIVVDAVSEVIYIDKDQIEETPAFGAKLDTDYILGMAKMEDSVKILLNIDMVLSTEEITGLKKIK